MKPKKNAVRPPTPPLEDFWKAFLENSPLIFWSMNLDGVVEFSTGKGLEWMGVKPKDRVGKSVFEIYREYPLILQNLRRALSGESFTEILRVGEMVFEVKFIPRRDARDRLVGSIGVATDVTGLQRTEELMDRREQHYRSLIENSHDVIYILDEQGHRIYESPSVEKVLGYRPGERAGQSVYEYIHPEDHANVRNVFEKLALAPGVTYRVELRARHKAGGWRYVEVAITNLLQDPAVRGWVINFWDITELKRAAEIVEKQEQYYRALTENTHELVVLLDREAVIRYATPSIQKILGYALADRIGKNFLDWVHPEDLYRTKEIFTQTYLATGRTLAADFRARHRDGGWRFLEASVTNLFNHPAVEGMILNARDVTERKKADEALRDRERYFRALTENAYDVVYVMDKEGRRFYESPSTERVLGYRPGDRDPLQTFSYLHPDDQAAGRAAFQRALAEPGVPVSAQLRTRHKDGRWIHMEVVATNLLDVSSVRGVVVNCRDITERKAAEEDLRHSEERFRNLIESSHDVVNLFDAEGAILYVSPSVKRVLGYDPSELAGQKSWEWIHPEDLGPTRPVFMDVLMSPGQARTAQIRLRHKAGSYRHIDLTLVNQLANPAVGGVIAIYRDVTEHQKAGEALRKSEENFRTLIEKLPDAMVVHTEQQVHYVNEALLRLLGYGGPEELVGKPPLQMLHPDDQESVLERIRRLKPFEGFNPPEEKRMRRKDGSYIQVESVSFSIRFEGTPMVVAVARDLTDRKAQEQALLKYERLGAIGEMAAGMAHEIRNPLSGIQLSAEYLLKKYGAAPEAAEQIKNILDQAARLGQLVNDTLDYSRDKAAHEKEVVDVMALFRTSLRLAQVQYGPGHRRFQIQWKLDWNLYFLKATPHRIQQVLVNLILNAFQALGEAGTVTLACEKRDGWIALSVADDGPGLADKDLDRLFEPFFTTKTSGSGLGLSVSRKIAQAHGGRITARRADPKGMVFVLELPAEGGGHP
ncbi:MAG TPA: PAS domain S-box protein [bacterium]|nr:PAS domain S-box protein [bacterium]